MLSEATIALCSSSPVHGYLDLVTRALGKTSDATAARAPHPEIVGRISLPASQESNGGQLGSPSNPSSSLASPSIVNSSKANSLLEYSQLGCLSLGWQDSPDIVSLFLSGQLQKYKQSECNLSFFDQDHEALFKPSDFEMKCSILMMKDTDTKGLCQCSTSISEDERIFEKNAFQELQASVDCEKCGEVCLSRLRMNIENLNADIKLLSTDELTQSFQDMGDGQSFNGSLTDAVSDGSSHVKSASNKDNLYSTTIIAGREKVGSSTGNFSTDIIGGQDYASSGPAKVNLFSTTIISSPDVIDCSTQLPSSPLPHTKGCVQMAGSNEESYRSSPSSNHAASTPSKLSTCGSLKNLTRQFHQDQTPHVPAGYIRRCPRHNDDDSKDRVCSIDQSSMNPFDSCTDSLQMPTVSPSLFKEVISPAGGEKSASDFRWSIEQIALLNPAHIELTSPQTHVDSPQDLEYEKKAQEAIEKFFSRRCILPSPWTNSGPKSRVGDLSERHKYSSCTSGSVQTPLSSDCRNFTPAAASPSFPMPLHNAPKGVSISCQTNLSFPPVLPAHVESLFALYSQAAESKTPDGASATNDVACFNNTSLRRRLLFSSEDSKSCSPSLTSFSGKSADDKSEGSPILQTCFPRKDGVFHHPSEVAAEPTPPIMSPVYMYSTDIGREAMSLSPIAGDLQQSSFDLNIYHRQSSRMNQDSFHGPMCSLSPDVGSQKQFLIDTNCKEQALILPPSPQFSPIRCDISPRGVKCNDCGELKCECATTETNSTSQDLAGYQRECNETCSSTQGSNTITFMSFTTPTKDFMSFTTPDEGVRSLTTRAEDRTSFTTSAANFTSSTTPDKNLMSSTTPAGNITSKTSMTGTLSTTTTLSKSFLSSAESLTSVTTPVQSASSITVSREDLKIPAMNTASCTSLLGQPVTMAQLSHLSPIKFVDQSESTASSPEFCSGLMYDSNVPMSSSQKCDKLSEISSLMKIRDDMEHDEHSYSHKFCHDDLSNKFNLVSSSNKPTGACYSLFKSNEPSSAAVSTALAANEFSNASVPNVFSDAPAANKSSDAPSIFNFSNTFSPTTSNAFLRLNELRNSQTSSFSVNFTSNKFEDTSTSKALKNNSPLYKINDPPHSNRFNEVSPFKIFGNSSPEFKLSTNYLSYNSSSSSKSSSVSGSSRFLSSSNASSGSSCDSREHKSYGDSSTMEQSGQVLLHMSDEGGLSLSDCPSSCLSTLPDTDESLAAPTLSVGGCDVGSGIDGGVGGNGSGVGGGNPTASQKRPLF
ncbi:uncharacterized threonine-rich GPI-anchored glycoprotein PJ4664.02 [Hyalella azteca]|uniref:Protein aurora borealis n=1 Tax=Hyalella azteca TaxID=294128 RepID=A0A8B7N7Z1_HYAAZ|nr:uncharacterized threonine-rich GPI-anchored glycoprotein PJ4664.02 [Hyalella azteca]